MFSLAFPSLFLPSILSPPLVCPPFFLNQSPTTVQPLVVTVELAEAQGGTQILVASRGVAEQEVCQKSAAQVSQEVCLKSAV